MQAASGDDDAQQLFHHMREAAHEGTIRIWSGGFSGAPAVFLTDEELEWECRWSETNADGTGLVQRTRHAAQLFFPRCAAPDQVAAVAQTLRRPVCGGYEELPRPGDTQPLWIHDGENWGSLPVRFLDGTSTIPGSDEVASVPHVALHFRSSSPLPDPARLAEQIASWCKRYPGAQGTFPGQPRPVTAFAETIPLLAAAELHATAPAVSSLRRSARLNRDRTRDILLTIAPHRNGYRPGPPGTAAPAPPRTAETFQGSTDGHLMMEDGGLTVRFAGGRIAGLSDDRGSTVPRRALGYLRTGDAGLPRTSYLATDRAAWFTAPKVRGVEEHAVLIPPGQSERPFELLTRTLCGELIPGVLLSYVLTIPSALPRYRCTISLMGIPVSWCDPHEETVLETVDSEGRVGTRLLPGGPGRWTVFATLIRVPVGTGPGFWIGSGEPPGYSTVIPIHVEKTWHGTRLLLSVDPVFHCAGTVPENLAGNRISGSIIMASGGRKPRDIHIDPDAAPYSASFSRIVPE